MHQRLDQQIIRLSAIISGHISDGTITFSPAPPPGVLAELAKFEAQRFLVHVIQEDIRWGRL
jgi:hypothetical protein